MQWNAIILIGSVIIGIFLVAGLGWAVVRFRRHRRGHEGSRAIQDFRLQREMLEAKFFDLAATSGKPRGLRWIDCSWESDVTFARDRETGLLTAFVAVNISFEAIQGGDMVDVSAVDTVRDAVALFHYQDRRWGTGGRALFNLNPNEALVRLENQFEPVMPTT